MQADIFMDMERLNGTFVKNKPKYGVPWRRDPEAFLEGDFLHLQPGLATLGFLQATGQEVFCHIYMTSSDAYP